VSQALQTLETMFIQYPKTLILQILSIIKSVAIGSERPPLTMYPILSNKDLKTRTQKLRKSTN